MHKPINWDKLDLPEWLSKEAWYEDLQRWELLWDFLGLENKFKYPEKWQRKLLTLVKPGQAGNALFKAVVRLIEIKTPYNQSIDEAQDVVMDWLDDDFPRNTFPYINPDVIRALGWIEDSVMLSCVPKQRED